MNTENNNSSNQLTTVKTIYARAVVLLLALNFCLTGYVVYNMNSTMQDQIDSVMGASPSTDTAAIPLSKKDD